MGFGITNEEWLNKSYNLQIYSVRTKSLSRTNHHKSQKDQHRGDDLWSRRPCAGMSYTTYNKQLTRKRERASKPEIIKNEILEISDSFGLNE